jgi:hypothetical protein
MGQRRKRGRNGREEENRRVKELINTGIFLIYIDIFGRHKEKSAGVEGKKEENIRKSQRRV